MSARPGPYGLCEICGKRQCAHQSIAGHLYMTPRHLVEAVAFTLTMLAFLVAGLLGVGAR